MTFREVLVKVVDDTPGAVGAALMGIDGIPVDEYSGTPDRLDLPAVAVEFQRVVDDARKVAGALYGERDGQLHELVLVTDRHQLLFRQIDEEYFLVVALEPAGVLGKARYRIRTLLDELRQEL